MKDCTFADVMTSHDNVDFPFIILSFDANDIRESKKAPQTIKRHLLGKRGITEPIKYG